MIYGKGAIMKQKLSIDELITHMKNKGIKFDIVSEQDARKFLINKINKLQKLIFRFETAYGLELLSTVHWVVQEFPDLLGNVEFIIGRVKKWNERKKVMFKDYQIKVTYQKLRENQLI